jgi:diadenosine tetraphosphate (Ap4A) HIT family hydrolase
MTSTPGPIRIDAATIVERGGMWTIAVNRNQNLLGKTVLVLERPCEAVVDVTHDEWLDVHRQLQRVCGALDELFEPDLYNHAFLMNQDKQVHLHTVPRYRSSRQWDGDIFTDDHWGSLFGTEQRVLPDAQLALLTTAIRAHLTP